METIKFPCGCEFETIDGRIQFDPDVETLNLGCPETWQLISDGLVKGVFQLESRLGQSFAKKLKPENIEHLSALLSIIRPGCLEAKIGKKTVTQLFVDRKNGEEEISYYHDSLEEILKPTFGLLVYQEEAMAIASKIAGFTLQEADNLRKAIGKKLPEEMTKVKTKYNDGCKTVKLVNDKQAEVIFGWIEKSQRYSFNFSHGISYATNSYITAYIKTHFPKAFFTSWLSNAKNAPKPQETIRELVTDSRNFDITINNPSIKYLNSDFKLINKEIYFGLINIKGIGASIISKIKKQVLSVKKKFNKKIEDITWLEFLIFILPNLNTTSVKALIAAGAFSHIKMSRKKMSYEYEKYNLLCGSQKTKDQKWIEANYNPKWTTLTECLTNLVKAPIGKNGGCSSIKRSELVKEIIQSLKSPPYSLKDSAVYIAEIEESILGIPLTCSKVEDCDISSANSTCHEFNSGYRQSIFMIACCIDRKHEIITKNKKKMAFLSIGDNYGSIDNVVVFPEEYKKFRPLLYEKNDIMISGNRGKEKDSLIVKNIYQL